MKKAIPILASIVAVASPVAMAASPGETAEQPAPSSIKIAVGRLVYSAQGGPIAPVYRITAAGEPAIILEGAMVTVPIATLSERNGKLTTTLSRAELRRKLRR